MSAWQSKLAAGLRVAGRVVPVVAGLALLVLVVAWISGFFETKVTPGEASGGRGRQASGLATDVVREVSRDYVEAAAGTVRAASRSVISAKVLATIDAIHVTAGDDVEPGDVLVTLKSQELEARLNQAREALVAAQAAEQEAESDFRRNERLMQSRSVSQQEFDTAQSRWNVAQADRRRAEQALREAEITLSWATIAAPKRGRIVDRLAEPGDTAQPGSPLLTLYDARSLRLEAPVMESLALTLETGQSLIVHVDSLGEDLVATIDEIVPQADSASRSFLIKATLPENPRLFEGMYGSLQIPAGTRRHLCIDAKAIHRIGQLEFVDVVRSDQTLQRRLVRTGQMGMPGRVEVLSGLVAGETVAVTGAADTDSDGAEATSGSGRAGEETGTGE